VQEFNKEDVVNRRRALELITIGGVGLIISDCTQGLPSAPTANHLQPLNMVVSSNGTMAAPQYYGYANGGESLIQAMENSGLTPQHITSGLGVGTYGFATPSQYGWLFAVQNNRLGSNMLGSDAAGVMLEPNQLWAVYKKMSDG
jgi:hypothetical protein